MGALLDKLKNAVTFEDKIKCLPASIIIKTKKDNKLYKLNICNLIGGNWSIWYEPAWGRKVLGYGDVKESTLEKCIESCLLSLDNLPMEKCEFDYDDIN